MSDSPITAEQILRDLRSGDDSQRHEALLRMESDATLREKVERLLATTVAESGFAATPNSGSRIGAYQLIQELGSGGNGAVFLAERVIDGARQRVALKLIHGIPTVEGRRRLARERALLAGLNHPNVSSLLDGGETEEGQPYLVMDYVDGLPITRWVGASNPDLAQRLRTMMRVCQAAQHAHERLVLHRDIKPGNILVRADGEPVLVDFGIGKTLAEAASMNDSSTIAFTPAYAAPEQLAGNPLTTATDVYGLGAVLFEVLAERSLIELRLDDTAAPVPSALALQPERKRQLRGDLDRIVAKAMHREPERRYPTPAALADDIERFLSGRTVLATPDSLRYRVSKFLRRHQAASVIAAIALLSLSVFVWRLAVERERAQQAELLAREESESAERARDFLVSVFKSAAPTETLGKPITPRELLDKARTRVEDQLNESPEVAVSTWMALADTYAALGDPAAAVEAARKALALAIGGSPQQKLQRADILQALAENENALSLYAESAAHSQEAVEIRLTHAPDDHALLADTFGTLGYSAQERGEPAQSLRHFETALAHFERVPVPRSDEKLAELLSGIAVSAVAVGDTDAAARHVERAEAAVATLHPRHPIRVYVLRARARLGELQGDFDSSLAALQEASALISEVVGVDNTTLATVENDLGAALNGLGRFREALVHFLRARAAYEKLGEVGVPGVAFLDNNISAVYERLGDYAKAIEFGRNAVAVLAVDDADNIFMRRQSRLTLARALSFAGEHTEALALAREALADGEQDQGADSFDHQLDRFRHASILRRAGEAEKALGTLRSCEKAILAVLGDEHPIRLNVLRLEALIQRDLGNTQLAIDSLRAALAFADATPRADIVAAAETRIELAELLWSPRPGDDARQLVEQALPILEDRLLPIAPLLARARELRASLSQVKPANG